MRKFGLIGFPLGHSFSKQYFTDLFIRESILDCTYENFELQTLDNVKENVLDDPELCGLNVTIPYKSEIIRYLDNADNEAVEVGAVNVIKISNKDGRRLIKGFNTDVYGFRESITAVIRERKVRSAIILGTGGSSKAVRYVLKKTDIDIINVSRIRGEHAISYGELSDEMLSGCKLIVNTTPAGMFPDIMSKPDLNYSCLTPGHVLFDLVYNPSLTAFLKEGEKRGCTLIGGLTMLHLQAEKSWDIWNDPEI